MKYKLNRLFFIVFCFFSGQKMFSQSQCFEIESILVAACSTPGQEGLNEMVRFKVGSSSLNTNNLSVSWPVSGHGAWPGVIQNTTSASKVAQLNADIISSGGTGKLIEPPGGIIPPNSKVILVTSYNLETVSNSFGALSDAIYIIFQKNPSNTTGHFSNTKDGTFTMSFSGSGGCSDTVEITAANLVQFGTKTAGAIVNYTPSGTATYVNNGCVAPVEIFTVDAGTTPINGCPGETVQLSGTAQGQQSVAWSAASGSFSASTALNTNYTISPTATGTIVLTLEATNASGSKISDTVTLNINSITPPTVISPIEYCQTNTSVLTATPSTTGATLNWYGTNMTGGTASSVAPIPTTTTVGSTSYYVSQTVGKCESSRVAIVVNVIADTGAIASKFFCGTPPSGDPNAVYFDWDQVPGRTPNGLYGYSYSIDGGTPIFGSTSATGLEVTGIQPGQAVKLTILNVPGLPCYPTQENTCKAACTTVITDFTSIQATQSICLNSTAPLFSKISDNGISGTWLPATVSNTASGTYEFTPDSTLFPCATKVTKQVVIVQPNNAGTINGNQNICVGSTTPLTPSVAGGTWSSLNTSIATVNASGVVTGLVAGKATIEYTVTGSVTCPADKAQYQITVTSTPNAGVLSGGPDVCEGQSILYQSTVIGGTWSSLDSSIATVNSSSGQVSGVSAGTTFIQYTVLGTNGCTNATPTIPVKVTAIPKAGTITGNQNICVKGTTTLTSSVTGGTWTSLNPAVAKVSASGLVTGVSGGSTKIIYTVKSTGICPGSDTTEVIIIVNQLIIPIFNQIGPICAGELIVLPPNSIDAISGTWSPAFDTNATKTYTFNPTSGQCANSTKMKITVNPLPIVKATVDNISVDNFAICSGLTTAIKLSSQIAPGTTYIWNYVQNNASGAATGSGDSIAQTLTALDNKEGEVVYSITPTTKDCAGVPKLVTVKVNPIPDVTASPTSQTVCSGKTTSIFLTSKVVGATFSWTVDSLAVIGSFSDSKNKIAQTLITHSKIPGTVDYTITPSKNGCDGTPFVVPVIVNPIPVATTTPSSEILCSGDSTSITLIPNILATEFSWTVVPIGVTGAEDGKGDGPIQQKLEAETNQGTVEYTITPTLAGCSGTPISFIETVNLLPSLELKDGVICVKHVDQSPDVTFKSYIIDSGLSDSNYTFEWYFNHKDNPLSLSIANTNAYEASKEGVYSLIVADKNTSCISKEAFATVIPNYPLESFRTIIVTDAFASDPTVTVVDLVGGTGPFLFQIDNGVLQSSNVFTNVSSTMPHTIYVKDEQGCTNLQPHDITIINYPKYFTPNGDGFNDTWNIQGLSAQPEAKIFIFDHYGKLLKQLSSIGEGWNGTFNGHELPATDYWFTVEYLENNVNKIFKAHFSLKR